LCTTISQSGGGRRGGERGGGKEGKEEDYIHMAKVTT